MRAIGVSAILGLAFIVVGCSGSTEPAASAAATKGPLSSYLTLIYGEADRQEEADDAALIDEQIARCMADQGFEYAPDPRDVIDSDDASWQPDDAEWVAQWGYGVVTWPGQSEAERTSTDESANTAYLDSLGPVAQDAWFETLYGPTPADDDVSPSWEEQGCWGAAIHAVNGDDPLQTDRHASLRRAIDDFYAEQFDADEYVALDKEWSDCMADAGRPGFRQQGDADLSIRTEVVDYHAGLEGEDPDARELDALHDREVELALVDLDCREATDYTARALVIRHTQEEEFVADHEAELDELVAEAQSGS